VTYAVYSYATMVPPVLLAMVLSSLFTMYINTEEYSSGASAGLAGAYQVYSTTDDGSTSNAELLGKGLLNALVIVCAIAAMTFVMVGCFYFNCNKFLMGYLLLSCFVLYGVMGAQVWGVAIEKYELNVDVITYVGVCVNFACLGIVSMFVNRPGEFLGWADGVDTRHSQTHRQPRLPDSLAAAQLPQTSNIPPPPNLFPTLCRHHAPQLLPVLRRGRRGPSVLAAQPLRVLDRLGPPRYARGLRPVRGVDAVWAAQGAG
jgi:hypothetical protein